MYRKFILPAIAILLVISKPVLAVGVPDEQPIKTDKQLAEYCKYLIEQVYQATDKKPEDWQLTSDKKGKLLNAKVKYRVGKQHHAATCSIKPGLPGKMAEFTMVEK